MPDYREDKIRNSCVFNSEPPEIPFCIFSCTMNMNQETEE